MANPSAKIPELTKKDEYVLRDGMPYADGEKHLVGPEVLLLTLERAYSLKHLFEEESAIKERYEKVYAQKLRNYRISNLAKAYRRAGADEGEALEKATAVVGREDVNHERRAKKKADREAARKKSKGGDGK